MSLESKVTTPSPKTPYKFLQNDETNSKILKFFKEIKEKTSLVGK